MYTKEQWKEMLSKLDTLAYLYREYEEKQDHYWELAGKKEDIQDNTGGLFALATFAVTIFVFIKFGWVKGLITLVVVGMVYDVYKKWVVKRTIQNKLQKFEEKYGEEMRKLEIEIEDIKKKQSDMETTESYIACKNYLPAEYMVPQWYDSYLSRKRLDIRRALDDAETLEQAIEIAQKTNT